VARSSFGETELGADYWIIRAGEKGIGGLQRAATGAMPHPGTRLYLEVADLEATLRRVTALGALVERERTALGGADRWFAIMRDPSGVSFGLWTPNPGDLGSLSPFSWPFHHLPWDRPGQKPQLLTGTGERARKVVKGLPGTSSAGRTVCGPSTATAGLIS
jgi:predicted enzyme related to lactoylglutathione lyase